MGRGKKRDGGLLTGELFVASKAFWNCWKQVAPQIKTKTLLIYTVYRVQSKGNDKSDYEQRLLFALWECRELQERRCVNSTWYGRS